MTFVATIEKIPLSTEPEPFPSQEYKYLSLTLSGFIDYRQHIEAITYDSYCSHICQWSNLWIFLFILWVGSVENAFQSHQTEKLLHG